MAAIYYPIDSHLKLQIIVFTHDKLLSITFPPFLTFNSLSVGDTKNGDVVWYSKDEVFSQPRSVFQCLLHTANCGKKQRFYLTFPFVSCVLLLIQRIFFFEFDGTSLPSAFISTPSPLNQTSPPPPLFFSIFTFLNLFFFVFSLPLFFPFVLCLFSLPQLMGTQRILFSPLSTLKLQQETFTMRL